jgi:hypothetical protein
MAIARFHQRGQELLNLVGSPRFQGDVNQGVSQADAVVGAVELRNSTILA